MKMNNRVARSASNEPIQTDNQTILLIEYKVKGFGSDADMRKLIALNKYIGPILKKHGLGESDGYRTGGNTMEVSCYVNDFAQAKSFIAERLANTLFNGYARIVEENAEYWKSIGMLNADLIVLDHGK